MVCGTTENSLDLTSPPNSSAFTKIQQWRMVLHLRISLPLVVVRVNHIVWWIPPTNICMSNIMWNSTDRPYSAERKCQQRSEVYLLSLIVDARRINSSFGVVPQSCFCKHPCPAVLVVPWYALTRHKALVKQGDWLSVALGHQGLLNLGRQHAIVIRSTLG